MTVVMIPWKHLMEGVAWANDLEAAEAALGPFFFDCGLRYVENHDEERLAHPHSWGGLDGSRRPAATSLFALSRGPVMVYHGQEVGEPGLGKKVLVGTISAQRFLITGLCLN